MFNGTVKRNGVKVTTPEFWFSWCLRIIWELNVDNIIVLKLYSWSMYGDEMLFFIKNTLRVRIRCLDVVAFGSHIVLLFSYLADTKCFLLVCLIGQSRRNVYHYFVDDHCIVALHPIMICNRWFCRGHQKVPRDMFISWEEFTSHLIIVVRIESCK